MPRSAVPVVSSVLGLVAALLVAEAAQAANEFPLAGTYMQNRVCRGDGKDPRAMKVTITDADITYSGGVCSISDKRVQSGEVQLRATCKQRNGNVLSGDVKFTMNDGQTVEMIDQDKNYKAVLHRCPE
jgi:hypothetical protein